MKKILGILLGLLLSALAGATVRYFHWDKPHHGNRGNPHRRRRGRSRTRRKDERQGSLAVPPRTQRRDQDVGGGDGRGLLRFVRRQLLLAGQPGRKTPPPLQRHLHN